MNKKKVSPEKFADVVDNIRLADIFLKSTDTQIHVYPTLIDPLNTKLDIDNKITFELVETNLFCFFISTISGVVAESTDQMQEGSKLFDLNVEIVLAYEVTITDPDMDAIELFASNNAYVNGFPFLRETIMSLSTRMSIPPVLLPLVKPQREKPKPKEAVK